ncbi:MAG: threonylcarbamoyl-AMP synthase [Bacteroidales bacterium]|nr:threonylcarbamoyl-AMP synthase [Bacteroidales bacterium]
MRDEVINCVKVLLDGKVILYPTDTIWGIGCDATNNRAVQKIFKIKQRPEQKSLIILLDKVEKLEKYVQKVPEIVYDLIKGVNRPLTIVYPNAKNLAKSVIAQDKSIAIRVVKDEFCQRVISLLDKPIVSTSANLSGENPPLVFSKISKEIIEQVDYSVKYNKFLIREIKTSTMVKIDSKGEFIVLRS